ncbi:Acylphosphatase [metagenome]|uniref:Acylphosphatase n=1 Tax=metagenome TaxID=256318 RepID=A0A2P2BXT0_9ZZZZ
MTTHVAARELIITGRVQGVAFRWTCQLEAERRGVAGWVTNEPDGSVRAWFEGPPADVQAMHDWCLTGPSGARVTRVDGVDRTPTGLTGFAVR